jgi:hypothetical protein
MRSKSRPRMEGHMKRILTLMAAGSLLDGLQVLSQSIHAIVHPPIGRPVLAAGRWGSLLRGQGRS